MNKTLIHYTAPIALSLAVALTAGPASAERRALLIGIDEYEAVSPLRGSKNDVAAMRAFITQHWGYREDEIKSLVDAQATRAEILKTLETWLVADAKEGDELLIYYSGHGYHQPDKDGDEDDRLDETLVPVDTRVEGAGRIVNMISDDEIAALIKKAGPAKVTAIIDSCHSGTVFRTLARVDESIVRTPLSFGEPRPLTRSIVTAMHKDTGFIERSEGEGERVVWTAVSPAQKALVDVEGEQPGGVFTKRFIAGITEAKADANANGTVTHAELLDYVQSASDSYCKRHGNVCDLGLTPLLEGQKNLLLTAVAPAAGAQPAGPAEPGDSYQLANAAAQQTSNNASAAQPPASAPAAGQEQTAAAPPAASSAAPVTNTPPPSQISTAAVEALTHQNDFELAIGVEPATALTIGDRARFSISSKQDGYLVLLDVNASGEMTQLFPNQFSEKAGKSNTISAGRPISIPDPYYGFEIIASEPAGDGLLIAVVTADRVALDDLIGRHMDLEPIEQPEDYLATLAQRLRRAWQDDDRLRRTDWSMAHQSYSIAR